MRLQVMCCCGVTAWVSQIKTGHFYDNESTGEVIDPHEYVNVNYKHTDSEFRCRKNNISYE